MFGKSAFGTNTGGFGQQPQQNTSVFGQQPQQQQPNAFGGFGASNTAGGFGAPNNNTSAFGQPAQQSTFGSPAPATGFGATTSAFGQPKPAGFGGGFGSTSTSAFGSAQPATNTGFGGGFGATPASNTSAFGSGTNNTSGGLFGQRPTTGGFGSTATTGAFGQPQQPQQSSAFGGGGFGAASGSAFGQPAGAANQGTAGADFAPTQDRDLTTGVNNFFQTITAMPQYKDFSLEELRFQDYSQGRKTGSASGGAFGQPATGSAFGQPANTMGGQFNQAPANNSIFGQPAATGGAFGQPAQSNAFGAPSSNTGGIFGQQQSSTPAFGQNTGTTGFGATNTNAFGAANNTGSTGFGASATGGGFGATAGAAKPFGFGSTSTAPTTGFGATTGGFGQPQQNNTGGFGQQPAQTGGFGGFGAKPANPTPSTGFGGFGNTGAAAGGFGAATSKPAASFGFGQTGTASTGTTGFGGFGAQNNTAGGFGQPASGATGGGLFGAAKPATSSTSLFGGNNGAATGSTGFGGFGASQNNTTGGFGSSNTGGLFGQKPATGTGGGLFGGGNTLGSTGFGGFGQQQQQNTGSFNLPAQGGMTSFGSNGLQNQQQLLVATVDKNPYGSNPLFDLSKTSGINPDPKSGPSAVAVNSPISKSPTPHYPISPRVVSKIKLRGFSVTPVTRPTKKKTSNSTIEGVSDDAVLGIGAFAPRENSKQLIFDDNIDPASIVAIVNKKTEKKKALFDPNLEYVASKEINNTYPPAPSTDVAHTGGSPSAVSTFPAASSSSAAIKRGYYMSPTIETLKGMSKDSLKAVNNFTIGRNGFGEVKFEKAVDLSEVDLDDLLGNLVYIDDKRVVVYPDANTKKPVGSELNVPALVKIENCFAHDKNTGAAIKDTEHPRYKLFIEKLRQRPNVSFVDYDCNNGIWTFRTEQF